MNWSTWSAALVGGLVGAFIPATLTYMGMLRGRQSADAEAFGPAMLLLDRVHPERVTINLNPDPSLEAEKWAELEKQLDTARERLLVVSAGNPRLYVCELAWSAEVKVFSAYNASAWAVRDLQANRDNPEWMDYARKAHDEAVTAMRDLIRANFGWHPVAGVRWRWRARQLQRQADTPQAVPQNREGPAPRE
jgi:hypothetical protein